MYAKIVLTSIYVRICTQSKVNKSKVNKSKVEYSKGEETILSQSEFWLAITSISFCRNFDKEVRMQTREKIKVYIDYKDGQTVCICKRSHKRCNKHCHKDVVERDKYRGWQQTCKVNKYGKTNDNDDYED